MIHYVLSTCQQAVSISPKDIWVATEDLEIQSEVKHLGISSILTPSHFHSGTDRVFFAASLLPYEIIINVQGDLPVFDPQILDDLSNLLMSRPDVPMATVVTEGKSKEDLHNPNIVKVVVNERLQALYFSRHPLSKTPEGYFWKHLGIYAFRRQTLSEFCRLPPSPLEQTEKLEQLRALECGIPIHVIKSSKNALSVDTLEDIFRVESYFNKHPFSV